MIAKAIREEHPQPRPLNITVEHFFKGYPGFSMLIPKIGCVAAHPANVHRLLYDEEQLVLVFPEGRKGTEKLYKDRYRLRRFGRGGFVEAAMRAQAPIVPVCVVGAEEAAPIFAQVNVLKRLTGLLYFPITPTFPHFGLLGMLGYLPAKFKIRFLEPIRFDEEGMHEDKALVQTVAHEVRARIQENLWDMVAQAQDGVVRMTMPTPDAILVTGLSTYWGGRLAQALEARRGRGRSIGVDNEEPQRRARAHRVREGRRPARAAAARGGGRRDRHGGGHPAGGRLDDHHLARKAHENNVIGTMNILAACSGRRLARAQGRLQVVGALLRLRAGRPRLLRRDDGPPAPAAHADRARHRRGRGVGRRVRREEPGRGRHDPALRERARPGRAHLAHRRSSRCRPCR